MTPSGSGSGTRSPATRRKQLAEPGKPLAGLLAAADGTALAGEIVTVLRGHGDDVLACLLPMLRAARPGPSAPLEELARDCERRLTAITERPARADDDWSAPGPAAALPRAPRNSRPSGVVPYSRDFTIGLMIDGLAHHRAAGPSARFASIRTAPR